jgi:hypothetical protein
LGEFFRIAATRFHAIGCEYSPQLSQSSARRVLFFLTFPTNLTETTMSDQTHTIAHAEELPREVLDLVDAITALPGEYRSTLEPFLNRVVDSNRRRRRILSLVQDALSQLRLDMKYLAFDLEATRRERDEFRQKLEGAE